MKLRQSTIASIHCCASAPPCTMIWFTVMPLLVMKSRKR